jgi:hypothetical protein
MNNDYDHDPDIFISELSRFVDGLNKQRLTRNYLDKSKKEFKYLFDFLSENGMYLIERLRNNSEKCNKIYSLLEQLSIIDLKRYPDDVDNFLISMRETALISESTEAH